MSDWRKTKIVATVGPAVNNKSQMKALVKAGVNVFRLNFSHGSQEDHLKVLAIVKELNEESGVSVGLLQDLQGPKIRTRQMKNGGVEIYSGQELTITTQKIVGDEQRISTTYLSLAEDVKKGHIILMDDGKIELEVQKISGADVLTKVVHGGLLKSRKGMNLPDTHVSAPSLTDKDVEDLDFGLEQDIGWVALSFVRTAKDIYTLKKHIEQKGKFTKVIAKIEKPEAVEHIDEIIDAADGLMVARGDLGVEIPMERVPLIQKEIVYKCNMAYKPVIIATQMLESMMENPRPTRAETNDVANAVLDGADALMLSGETAAGKFPIQSVQSMAKTIDYVEKYDRIYNKQHEVEPGSVLFLYDDLVATACRLATRTGAKAIVGMTKSGYTAYRLSGHRPRAGVFVFTSNKRLLHTLNLVWGVKVIYYEHKKSTDETFSDIETTLKEHGYLKKGDVWITTASMPLHWEKHTNMLKISVVV